MPLEAGAGEEAKPLCGAAAEPQVRRPKDSKMPRSIVFVVLLAGSLAGTALGVRAFLSSHENEQTLRRMQTSGESVDCGLRKGTDSKSLVILTSTAVPNTALKEAFRTMILRLPDQAWPEDGAAKKKAAEERAAPSNFHEPSLYSGLKVLCLEDAGFLKRSFWDPSNKDFGQASGVNYKKTGMTTSPELVKEATRGFRGLDGGWGSDYGSTEFGGFGGFGFDKDAFTHVSLFDLLATDEQKRAVFELQSQDKVPAKDIGKADATSAKAERFLKLLEEADILAVNGGNPDFAVFVFTVFAAELMKRVKERVAEGSLIYFGRSAGAMVASRDVGLTYEPNPLLLDKLLGMRTSGMGLVGKCVIRPHYKAIWDLPAALYENATGDNVVLLPNGEGLCCMDAQCKVNGKLSHEGVSMFDNGDGPSIHFDRMKAPFDDMYSHYDPPALGAHSTEVPLNGLNCSMSEADAKSLVLLTSTALANPPLKQVFRDMVLRLPDSAWEKGGAEKKAAAKKKAVKTDFHEPDLYSGLKVLALEDAGLLKESFWNRKNKHFSEAMGLNFEKVNTLTKPALVEQATNGFLGLDGGWICDYSSPYCGGLGGLGFDKDAFTSVSLFDMLADDEEKRAVFELQARHKVPAKPLPRANASGPAAERVLQLLASADILAVNGGNPDFLSYIFTVFAGDLMEKVKARVREGSLIYLGRSAGAMAASADVSLTFEPDPALLDHLLSDHLRGMALAGNCVIRPHYASDKVWDILSGVYEQAKGVNVVRLPNGEGLACINSRCRIYGATSAEGHSIFEDGDTSMVHLERIDEALNMAIDHAHSQRSRL